MGFFFNIYNSHTIKFTLLDVRFTSITILTKLCSHYQYLPSLLKIPLPICSHSPPQPWLSLIYPLSLWILLF